MHVNSGALYDAERLAEKNWMDEFAGRSFLSCGDFSRSALSHLLDLAIHQKTGAVQAGRPLEGKSVALVFFNPSLRTRVSMSVAVQRLGGFPVVLEPGSNSWNLEWLEGAVMDGDKAEHVKEAAPVLSSYVDAIGVRCFPRMLDYGQDRLDPILRAFQRHSTVPVINLESCVEHPLQSLGDVMTIRERFGTVDQRRVTLTWAYHPKALPMAVPNSFALAAAQFGMNLTIGCPPEYGLDPEVMGKIGDFASQNGSQVRVVHDQDEACRGAEVVYAKSWGALDFYGRPEQERLLRERYRDWTVDADLMEKTADGVFMHCLPVRRNVVVADAVLDGPRSIVLQQAANRLHVQKTLLGLMLGRTL